MRSSCGICIIDASNYLFSYNHALPYSFIGYIIGYLRYYYKLETLTSALNIYAPDKEKSNEIIRYTNESGIKIYPIKFGKSGAEYMMDKDNNAIYKGIASIKYLNTKVANSLLELSKNHKYKTFVELLKDIYDQKVCDSRQLEILIKLNFFSEFGKSQYLLDTVNIFDKIGAIKVLKKDKLDDIGITEYAASKFSGKETAKQYKDIDNIGLVKYCIEKFEDTSIPLKDYIKAEKEYLGYVSYVNSDMSDEYYLVVEFIIYSDETRPYLVLRKIKDGTEFKTRIKRSAVYKANPFGELSLLKIEGFTYDFNKKRIDGEYVTLDDTEPILEEYEVI